MRGDEALLKGCPVDTQVEQAVFEVGGVLTTMRSTHGHRGTEVLIEPVFDHFVIDDPAAVRVEADEVAVEACPRDTNIHGVSSELADPYEGRQGYLRPFVPGLDMGVPLQPQAGVLKVAGLEHVLDDTVLRRPGVKVRVVHWSFPHGVRGYQLGSMNILKIP